MAQGTFVQALRKEAALSGTFMKGRSLMLNGAVLSIEDSGSRFSKNVTVEGSVRGSRGDLYKTHVALDMDEPEVIELGRADARGERADGQKCYFVIINELFERALFDLKAIVHAQRLKYSAQKSARAGTFEGLGIA